MFWRYPIVNDSCICITFIECISNFFGKYMDNMWYEHTLFHDCERCLWEVTFYYKKLKYEKKVLSFQIWRAYKGGLKMHANESLMNAQLYTLCPLNGPIHALVCPMSFEIPMQEHPMKMKKVKKIKMKGKCWRRKEKSWTNSFSKLHYTFQVKLRHKWFLNFHGTAFACCLRSFNIFIVTIPHHIIKGA